MIKAAERRLAFAKQCERAARTQLEAAEAEAAAATAFLDETRDRLQVIDVDAAADDDDEDVRGGGDKRKASASSDDRQAKAARTAAQAEVAPATDARRPSAVQQKILVQGAGRVGADGVYDRQNPCVFIHRHPSYAHITGPVWCRQFSLGKYYIFRDRSWILAYSDSRRILRIFYLADITSKGANVPPKSGWSTPRPNVAPAPQLTTTLTDMDAEGNILSAEVAG